MVLGFLPQLAEMVVTVFFQQLLLLSEAVVAAVVLLLKVLHRSVLVLLEVAEAEAEVRGLMEREPVLEVLEHLGKAPLAELLERPQQQTFGLAAAAAALRQREVMLQEMQVETEVMELHLASPGRLLLMLAAAAEVLETIRMAVEIPLARVVLEAVDLEAV